MITRAQVVLIGGIATLLLVVIAMREPSTVPMEGNSAVPRAEESSPLLLVRSRRTEPSPFPVTPKTVTGETTNELPIRDSDRFLSLDRFASDPEYQKIVRHHLSIKSYLNSPIRGTPDIEELLKTLLRNGSSIEDLFLAYLRIHLCSAAPQPISQLSRELLQNGMAADDVEARVARETARRKRHQQRCIESSLRWVGLEHALDEFLMLAPIEYSAGPGPAYEFLPLFEPAEGEVLLRDAAWMTAEHREIVANYNGPKRSWMDHPRTDLGTNTLRIPPPSLRDGSLHLGVPDYR